VSGELEVMEGGDAEAMRASLECPEAFEPIFDRHHRVIWATWLGSAAATGPTSWRARSFL